MKENMRKESDSIGEIDVPSDKYWGAQTQRSIIHFSIGDNLMPIEMIHSMGILKKAAASTNYELGVLDLELKNLIVQAADEVIEGKLNKHFPLHVWMTGSGTQSNMNVNEVISNRAIEIVGGSVGSKKPVHPNDHVNMSQSSNDTFPTAMSITVARLFTSRLFPAVEEMLKELNQKAEEWKDIVKIARTHMQDAVPMTLGQGFAGYATLLKENLARIKFSLNDVYHLALGGTAIGTGVNTHPKFAELSAEKIAKETGLPFITAADKFAVQGSHDALVMASGTLKTLACSLYKIANDIRLLSCGPRAGFHELLIPSNEPGSSIMPGKVNPTQCEAMAMAAIQVMANDTAVSFAGAGGLLEMNVYKPIMIHNIVESVKLLSDCCINFSKYCLRDSVPNKEKIDQYLNESLMLVTALSPVIGYDKASKLAHYADRNKCTLREANAHYKFVTEEEFTRVLDPYKMAYPHQTDRKKAESRH
jgi:fumarate hydratase class II